MTLRVERSTSFEGLKTPWSDLLDKSPEGSLFLSYEWASTWWKHFGSGADLWLLLVWDEDELLGVAPMTIRRVRYSGLPVRMLGMFANKHVSRADILSPTRPAEVMHALVRYWKRHHGFWDVLKLEGIPLSSATNQLLPTEVRQSAMCGFPFEKTNDLYYLPTQEPQHSGIYSPVTGRHYAIGMGRIGPAPNESGLSIEIDFSNVIVSQILFEDICNQHPSGVHRVKPLIVINDE